ncbi:uncharacterized protein LOC133777449 [Humulus lupulus]|uniref:uncharacterized protein LOC133777449 n=1 Tax=Humulus lupulus TaxID=3486 RepID=UPI002B403C46|nr:uncharacterized protein LOC133777449 [Humulus lupulus]
MFTITQADADANNSVVSDDIFVSGILTHALIDSSVTHSFASLTYVKRLGRSCQKLSEVFSTMLPSREILYSTHWLRGVPICIDGRELYVDLIMLEMHDYEVILGMDWLSKYNVTIDCRKKTVIFKPSKEVEFMFIGTTSKSCIPLIFVMKARRLLESGCMSYLASVVDSYKEQNLKPEDVLVVRDFLEVFPEDLPRLPSDREIEFVIELLPVADVLSRKSRSNVSIFRKLTRPLQEDMRRAEIEVITGRLSVMTIQSTLLERIKQGQCEDPYLVEQKCELESGKVNDFSVM